MICTKCHRDRDPKYFYSSKPQPCKTCIRTVARKYYYANKEKFTAWRKNNKDKISGYDRNSDKKKKSARSKVSYAVKTGKIVKPVNCEICDRIRELQGHHRDYEKPLDVNWLCQPCHLRLHRKDV